jgi:hypothetical protein
MITSETPTEHKEYAEYTEHRIASDRATEAFKEALRGSYQLSTAYIAANNGFITALKDENQELREGLLS